MSELASVFAAIRISCHIALVAGFLSKCAESAYADHGGGRDYAQADRLIEIMEHEVECLARDYPGEIRGITPTTDQRAFSSAVSVLNHTVRRLRGAFDDGRYSRVAYEFNQVENRFKTADRYRDRARVSPSAKCHLDTTKNAIASLKTLRSSEYGLKK